MSEVRSNSSYALSSVQFNSKSLNPLDSIHPSVLNKIKRQADSYLGCSKKCGKIWEALTKNDIAGSHMTENVMEVIFRQFKNDLSAFTKVSSVKEFMKIFDEDKDGCLNADEQIQIFSFIKERLELVANNCLQIQEYIRFQNLMKQVRNLEANIAKWQTLLREKIHTNQIQQFRTEGTNKIDDFCDIFDKEYENLQKIKLQRRETFEKQAFYESQALEERLNQPSEYLKIKPQNKLKQLQFQQKLVSLQQRVYQALDFRRQLNELEVKEKERVDKLMSEHANQKRQNLRFKHQKQRKELEQKLEQLENKLIIKMKRQFDVLRKKNNLHELEIRRYQGLQRKWAQKKGLFEPQLKRTKKLERKRNEVLSEYRKAVQGMSQISDEDATEDGKKSAVNRFNAKSLLSNTTKFKLTNKSESDIPVNSKVGKLDGNQGAKIYKYITPKAAEKTFSICKLYNSQLQEEEEKPVISQELVDKEKMRKYQLMVTKLF